MEEKDSLIKEYRGLKPILIIFANFFVLLTLLVSVLAVTISSKERKNYLPTTATITEVDDGSRKVYISYEVDGKEYKNINYGNYTPYFKEGETLEILYSRDNPKWVLSKTNSGLIFLFVSIALTGCSLTVLIYYFIVREKKRENLINNGDKKLAKITKVYVSGFGRRNRINHKRVPYADYLLCEADGRTFKSAPFILEGQELEGKEITVYISKEKPSKYYVDLKSFK